MTRLLSAALAAALCASLACGKYGPVQRTPTEKPAPAQAGATPAPAATPAPEPPETDPNGPIAPSDESAP